ncbi:MAG: monovalent cation/H+ antiporter subunit D family protein [Vicinamibacteria bacterium]|nr:monovalent cation/H+ antiporter subunit D family protein [Vicinamibacteria bacterium]
MIVESIRPGLAVASSLAAAGLILASGRRPNLREAWTLIAALVKLGLIVSLLPGVCSGIVYQTDLFEIMPGVRLFFRADPLGMVFGLVASLLWLVTSVYSIGYMREIKARSQTRYFFCFALCLSSTIGVAFAGNLLTFLICYEVLTIATYPLVIHNETREAVAAGRKYLVYTLTGGGVLLLCVAWTYRMCGTLDFVPGGFLAGQAPPQSLMVLFALFMAACGVKAALMPLHAWLPTAMVAPTPVSALLHAVAVVKAGVFGILRIFGFVFGPSLLKSLGVIPPLAALAAFTIITASIIALYQNNLKRRLAYSTISQLSYIILGAAILTPTAFTGSIMHLANHAFMKITLFFCAGAIYCRTHIESIDEMGGIGRQMPVTMGAFAVASMGLTGVPFLCGFVSKWHLGLGAVEAGEVALVFVLVISGLLNASYFFPIVYAAFFIQPSKSFRKKEHRTALLAPIVATAILSVLFGAIPFLIERQHLLASLSVSRIWGQP